MKIRNITFIIMFIFILSSISYAQLLPNAQNPPAVPEKKEKKKEIFPKEDWFKLKAKVNKMDIIYGEPIYLTTEIDNLTTNSFRLNIIPALTNEVAMIISSNNGASSRYIGSYDKKLQYISAAIDMVPQSNACWDYAICYDLDRQNGYYFDMEGNYKIDLSARITIEKEDQFILYADPINIKVSPPTGIDKEAFDFLYNKECAKALHNLSTDEITTPKFEEFLKKFPNSIYAQYIEYSLIPARAGELTTKDLKETYKKEIVGYESYIKKYPQSPLKFNAMYKIAGCEYYLQNNDRAKEYLNKIKKEDPNAPQVNRYDVLNYNLFYSNSGN